MTEQEQKKVDLKRAIAIAEAEFEIVRMEKRRWDNLYELHDRKVLDAKGEWRDYIKEQQS